MNWSDRGLKDGQSGQFAERFETYQSQCADFEIELDFTSWQRGYREGLKTYCTPLAAFELGKDGRAIREVCAEELLPSMRWANTQGRELHFLELRILNLRAELRDARQAQASAPSGSSTAVSAGTRAFQIQNEIFALENHYRREERAIRANL